MNNETYHLDTTRISKSGLDAIDYCPALYKSKYLDRTTYEPTRDQFQGTALHAIYLEPSIYWSEIYPQLTPAERRIIDGQKRAIQSHPAASKLLKIGSSEVLHLWTDETTGAECKLKADFLPEQYQVVVDLKRMRDVSPAGFRSSVRRYRYDVQAAFYLDGLEKTNPKTAFIFICVEPTPPFRVAVYQADETMVSEGREKYIDNLHTYVECRRNNVWPAYQNPKITTL